MGGGVGVGVVAVSTSILLAGVMYYLIMDLEDDKTPGPGAVGSLEGARAKQANSARLFCLASTKSTQTQIHPQP
jgi:hypothetical protein